MLYIVSTPIGNLKDITLRALEVLKSVDLIACEDTRHTKILLDHYGVMTATTSYFQHSRLSKTRYLIGLLKEGKSIALVTDSGTPGILDPGRGIIKAAIENNIPLTVIPGPSALIGGLVVSGKPASEFIFLGFLPKGRISRMNRLREAAGHKYTVVFYESCHRIVKTLEDIKEVFGERDICCVRELTKKFEEIKRSSASRILDELKKAPPRGEFVVVI